MRRVALLAFLAASVAFSETPYFMVFLRTAPDRKPISKEEGERIQTAHMANIRAMAARGLMVAAGPFEDDPPVIRGLFVFKVPTLDEARSLAEQDPTVQEHRNTVQVFEWRGPDGVGEEYTRRHTADPKTPEGMGVHPFVLLLEGSAYNMGRDAAMRDHAAYVAQLRKAGKVAAEGPVRALDGGNSLVIFNRISAAEAKTLIEADPAVRAGVLKAEFHQWWSAEHVLPK